jgi:hypothetical protein
MGEINVYKILVGKPEGKRPLGRIIWKWGLGDVDYICVAQDTVTTVKTALNIQTI